MGESYRAMPETTFLSILGHWSNASMPSPQKPLQIREISQLDRISLQKQLPLGGAKGAGTFSRC